MFASNEVIEGYLEKRLAAEIEDFSMDLFLELLKGRPESDLQGEVFELLHSFSDFNTFKDLMIDYKKSKSSNMSQDLYNTSKKK